jgi:histidyl-tRNA synthetase
MEIKNEFVYKGTRILFGAKAERKRDVLSIMVKELAKKGYDEIFIPVVQFQGIFANKVGENKNLMFDFTDRAGREICLAPEYTAVCQYLATTQFKRTNDVKMFYVGECFRCEKPQAGRYRQFTQVGVEILNPTKDYLNELILLAQNLIVTILPDQLTINRNVTRGLDYYEEGKGFEITYEPLGAQKQICGGGRYTNGIGFAIGLDRMLEVGA